VTLLIDTGALVAAADVEDPHREAVQQVLASMRQALVVPAPITGEADYLLGRRIGRAARLALLDDIAKGLFQVEGLTRADWAILR
jgi:predicted nucleic acid-binding protein